METCRQLIRRSGWSEMCFIHTKIIDNDQKLLVGNSFNSFQKIIGSFPCSPLTTLGSGIIIVVVRHGWMGIWFKRNVCLLLLLLLLLLLFWTLAILWAKAHSTTQWLVPTKICVVVPTKICGRMGVKIAGIVTETAHSVEGSLRKWPVFSNGYTVCYGNGYHVTVKNSYFAGVFTRLR